MNKTLDNVSFVVCDAVGNAQVLHDEHVTSSLAHCNADPEEQINNR